MLKIYNQDMAEVMLDRKIDEVLCNSEVHTCDFDELVAHVGDHIIDPKIFSSNKIVDVRYSKNEIYVDLEGIGPVEVYDDQTYFWSKRPMNELFDTRWNEELKAILDYLQ